jgi:uncharacterized OB-fold protein
MADPTRTPPAPPDNVEAEPFFAAAAEGRFLVRFCADCGKAHWYPRTICPLCFGAETEWREAAGKGVIYSYTVMRRAPEPYALAYVTLDEGPTMLTNIVDCDFETLAIGQEVRLVFKPSEDGTPVPMFAPD